MNKTQALVWNVLRLVLVTGMVVLSAIACDTGSGGGSNGDPPGGDPPGGDPPGGDPPGGDPPDGDPPDGDTPDGDTPGEDTPGEDPPGGDDPPFTYPIATLKADGTIEATPIWNENPGAGVSYAISPSFGTDNNSTLSFDKTDGTITGKMPDAGKITVYTITATGDDDNSGTTTGTFVDRFTFESYTPVTTGTPIGTAQDLRGIADANGEYYLTNHIDLSALASTWTPLFAEDDPFKGTLHGNGYVIYNLEIAGGADDHYQGLFAALEDASIENLGIGVKNIAGGGAIGALAGYAKETVTSSLALSNIAAGAMSDAAKIKSTASLTIDAVDGSYVGGVIGYLEAGTLENAYNLVAVEGTSSSVGGLVGVNEGTVTGYATGDVSGNDNYAGGLLGYNQGTATGYATGDVSGGNAVGGLVGHNWSGTVTGYATGAVSGTNYVGGLVGLNWGSAGTPGTATGYARGSVTRDSGTRTTFGLLAGSVNSGTVSGYHSGAAGESVFDGILAAEAIGKHGTEIDITTAAQGNFEPTFTFGTAVGRWIWTADEWPAIVLTTTQ